MVRKLKRWISSLLAVAVAVSVMPMGGIAVFGSQERTAGLCVHHPEHTAECGYSEERGALCGYQCSVCGIDALSGGEDSGNAASVTKNGETTYVADLTAAFASENLGAEVKLLSDVTVSQTIEIKSNFPASLDLAGHTVYADVGDDPVFNICESAAFTIKDSAGNGAVKGQVQTEDWYASLALEGGTFESVSLAMGKKLTVTGGNVHIDDLFINTFYDITAQLSAGTYGHIWHGYGCKRLLAGGDPYYAFHDADGRPVPVSDSTQELNNVTVCECSHDSSVRKYEKVDDVFHKMTCLACGYEGEPEAHENDGNGCCAVCSAVKVTLDGVPSYLSSLADAFQSGYDGAEITLLNDINVSQAVNVASGSFTLDLAGYAVNFSGTNVWLEVGGSANLTILDSAGSGCLNSIYMSWQENNAELLLEGGSFDDIYAAGGTLSVTGDQVKIGKLFADKNSVWLSAGTYGSISVLSSSDGYSLGDILLNYGQTEGPHYAFYDSEGNLVDATVDSVQNVTVKECNHEGARIKEYTWLDGQRHNVTCLACGYGSSENHNASGAGGLCECIAVKVEQDGNTEYACSLNDAFLAAQSGAVITLLKDVKGGQIDASGKSLTLELDGHAISGGLEIGATGLTINDGAEDGTIEGLVFFGGKLTVNGGRFTSDYAAASLYDCAAEINGGDFSGGRFGMAICNSEVTVNGGCFHATGELPPEYEDMGEIDGMDFTASGLLFEGGTLKLRGGEFSGKDCAIEIVSYSDEEETAALSGLLGHTDTKRYAYYNGAAPVTEGLDGTSLTGTITVKECGHETARFTNNGDGTHTCDCNACGQTLDAKNCAYTFSGTTGICAACKGSVAVEVSGTENLVYDGTAKMPGVTVTRDGTVLAAGTDYSVSYSDNVNAGAVKVTVTIGNGQGAYTGNFTIGKARPKVTWSSTSQELTYTGNPAAITAPAVTLANDEDFSGTISYSYKKEGETAYKDGLPTDAGTYTVKAHVDAAGNYAAADSTNELALTIKKADAEITVLTDAYDVSYGDPAFTISGVTDTNPETAVQYAVTEGTDVLSVSNGTVTIRNAGTAVITVSLPESANYNTAENKTITVNVAKKSGYAADALNRNYFYQDGGTDSIDLAALLPKDCGNVDYGEPAVSGNVTYSAAPAVSGGKLSYTLESGNVNEEGTITVTVATRNFEDITVTVNVNLTDQIPVSLKTGTEVTLKNNVLTYGEPLSDLVFNEAEFVGTDGKTVTGTLAWKEAAATPNAGTVSAVWVFTPTENKYASMEGTAAITVNKAQNAPNMPGSTMDVSNSLEKVGDVPLPEGWEWWASDRDTVLEVGKPVSTVAVYTGADKGNYEKETVTAAITRSACDHVAGDVLYTGAGEKTPTCTEDGLGHRECTKCGSVVESGIVVKAVGHTGGTVTCSKRAVCTRCNQPYGDLDSGRHGDTEVRGFTAATCIAGGYTGDTYCKDCGAKTKTGNATPALGHNYTSTVTKEPTTGSEGTRTYTCTRCGHSYTESIPKLPEETHTHSYGTNWESDSNSHWHGCLCGEKADIAAHTEDGGSVTKPATETETGIRTYKCSVCGYVMRTEVIDKLSPTSTGTPTETPQETVTSEEIRKNSEKLDSGIVINADGNKFNLSWEKVGGAEGYDIFAAPCGKMKLDVKSLIKSVKGEKTSASLAKIAGRKISGKNVYQVKIRAWQYVDGKKVYIGSSRTYYVAGKAHRKYTNAKKLKPEKKKYVLKKGRSIRIKVTVIKESKKKKLLPKSYGPVLRYASSDKKIATVTQKGTVMAKKKGVCYITVVALNGVRTRIKITVK